MNAQKKNHFNLDELKAYEIILYPAGINGRQLFKTLKENAVNVKYFVDRAHESLKKIDSIPVYSPEILRGENNACRVIVCANLDTQFNHFKSNIKKINPDLTIINGQKLNRNLKIPICMNRLNNGEAFDLIDCENCGFERHECRVASAYLKKVGKHKEKDEENPSKSFDWFGYIVSQNCTLRCKHCCEQIPLLPDKGFPSVESIVNDIKQIAQSTYFLNFVELIGGEPFLHPGIEHLITELLAIDNIGYIKSFTNATIVPSDQLCKIMQNPRFMLQVSNYEKMTSGKLHKNIITTKKKLSAFNIRYLYTQNFEWLDFTDFKKHNASSHDLEKAFDRCFLKNCHRVYKGKLYRCPHHYAGIQLGQLAAHSHECINIHDVDTVELSMALEAFENLRFIDACRYCELAFNPKPVPAGQQLEHAN